MRIKRNGFFFLYVLAFMLIVLSSGYAQYKIKTGPSLEKKRLVPIVDNPQIKEFSANPSCVIKGKEVLIRWKVEPGPGGSPISRVSISRTEGIGPDVWIGGNELTGEKTIAIPANAPDGTVVYALTSVNRSGRSSVETVTIEIMPVPDIVVGEIKAERIDLAVDMPDKYYAIYFDIRNIGGDFIGKLTIRATIDGCTVPIAISRGAFNQATMPMVVSCDSIPFPNGRTERYYLRGEGAANGWIGGNSYECYILISTDNSDEYTRNNGKQVVLNLEK